MLDTLGESSERLRHKIILGEKKKKRSRSRSRDRKKSRDRSGDRKKSRDRSGSRGGGKRRSKRSPTPEKVKFTYLDYFLKESSFFIQRRWETKNKDLIINLIVLVFIWILF